MTSKNAEIFTNLFDYLSWRGDLAISKESPLNTIDSMILARFSYLDFSTCAREDDSIANFCAKIKSLPEKHFVLADDRELAERLENAKRFKNLKVSDVKVIHDKEKEQQFGAITLHLPRNELFVIFVGTDDTLIGWREDLNLIFLGEIPSQNTALNYLKKILEKYPEQKIRLAGHSKGGNLAIFSALSLDEELQKRVIAVESFDGPGLSLNTKKLHKNPEIFAKITNYLPQESIVGRLLNHEEKIVVVRSAETGLFQHDLYSWFVKNEELVEVGKTKHVNYIFNETLRAWLASCSEEQRQIFVDNISEALLAVDYASFSELRRNALGVLPTFMRTYRKKLSKDDKKILKKMLKLFFKQYRKIQHESSKEAKKQNRIAHKANRKARKAKNKALKKAGKKVRKYFS